MRLWLMILIVLIACCGCRTHLSLRHHTIQTASTIADLHYQQVIDNIARYVEIPSTVPSIAIVNNGTVSVTDQSTFGAAGTYAPTLTTVDQIGGFPIFSLFLNPNVARGLAENWTLAPVTDNDKLRRMRCAFQYVVNQEAGSEECVDCQELLAEALALDEDEKLDCDLPRGWFCAGCKREVPKDACFVGRYRDRFVWVMPWGMDGLSRFTLTVLELATTDVTPNNRTVVRHYDAEDNLEGTEITTIEADTDNMGRSSSETASDPISGPSAALPRSPKLNRNAPLSPKQQRRRPGAGSLMAPRL